MSDNIAKHADFINEMGREFVPGMAVDFAECAGLMDNAGRDGLDRFGEAQPQWQRLTRLCAEAMNNVSKVMDDTARALLDAGRAFDDTDADNGRELTWAVPRNLADIWRPGDPTHSGTRRMGLGDFDVLFGHHEQGHRRP